MWKTQVIKHHKQYKIQNQKYDLPEGLSNDEAKAKIINYLDTQKTSTLSVEEPNQETEEQLKQDIPLKSSGKVDIDFLNQHPLYEQSDKFDPLKLL